MRPGFMQGEPDEVLFVRLRDGVDHPVALVQSRCAADAAGAELREERIEGRIGVGGEGPIADIQAGPGDTRADQNNNPGNIKMGPVARQFGAVSQDDQGHAIFPTWERGNAAQAQAPGIAGPQSGGNVQPQTPTVSFPTGSLM